MAEQAKPNQFKKIALICVALFLVTGGLAVWQRTALQCWYFARQMQRTTGQERHDWADKLAGMGDAAVPRLLSCLSKDDPGLCESVRSVLALISRKASGSVPVLAKQVCDAQSSCSAAGKAATLDLIPQLLELAPETATAFRPLIIAGLQAPTPELRVPAIACALRAEMNLLVEVVPLLHDDSAQVRRAAMLALGPQRDGVEPVVSTDELLRWLHDPDDEVRRHCELALRGRGLTERNIYLARQLTDPEPVERLKLLVQLPRDDDFSVVSWLERLSNDSDSAVRAGAARLAVERRVDFAERLGQMSRTDPDQTVRRIAAHYLKLCEP